MTRNQNDTDGRRIDRRQIVIAIDDGRYAVENILEKASDD